MTTKQQIAKLVRPLLDRHDDLALVEGHLYLKPVDHVLAAIVFERTGEAKRMRPRWAVMHFCQIFSFFSLGWGRMIGGPGANLWYWDDPSMPERLLGGIEEEILPLLRRLQRFDSFVALVASEFFSSYRLSDAHLENAVVTAALGEFERTKDTCAELLSGRTRFSLPFFKGSFDRVVKQLYPLVLADDRAGVAALLHEWEAISMKNFGLAHVWTPTPFPLERQPAP